MFWFAFPMKARGVKQMQVQMQLDVHMDAQKMYISKCTVNKE